MTLPGWDRSAETESEREAPAEESELVAINPNSTHDSKQQTCAICFKKSSSLHHIDALHFVQIMWHSKFMEVFSLY